LKINEINFHTGQSLGLLLGRLQSVIGDKEICPRKNSIINSTWIISWEKYFEAKTKKVKHYNLIQGMQKEEVIK
jgi:hypothetical protein